MRVLVASCILVLLLTSCAPMVQQEDIVEKFACPQDDTICAMAPTPVCGWFSPSVECENPPCAITATSPCEACKTPEVEYWSKGVC